jgi:hypothetical protein
VYESSSVPEFWCTIVLVLVLDITRVLVLADFYCTIATEVWGAVTVHT